MQYNQQPVQQLQMQQADFTYNNNFAGSLPPKINSRAGASASKKVGGGKKTVSKSEQGYVLVDLKTGRDIFRWYCSDFIAGLFNSLLALNPDCKLRFEHIQSGIKKITASHQLLDTLIRFSDSVHSSLIMETETKIKSSLQPTASGKNSNGITISEFEKIRLFLSYYETYIRAMGKATEYVAQDGTTKISYDIKWVEDPTDNAIYNTLFFYTSLESFFKFNKGVAELNAIVKSLSPNQSSPMSTFSTSGSGNFASSTYAGLSAQQFSSFPSYEALSRSIAQLEHDCSNNTQELMVKFCPFAEALMSTSAANLKQFASMQHGFEQYRGQIFNDKYAGNNTLNVQDWGLNKLEARLIAITSELAPRLSS
jgi:hypothetical protein